MLKSMTGYGRALGSCDGREILVEIRSVNHRFYEFSSRVPRAYGYLDERLKSLLNGKITRGKVEVAVSIFNNEVSDACIELNRSVTMGYLNALLSANEEIGLENDLALSHIMRLPDVFTVKKIIDDEEEIWSAVKPVAEEALDKFVSMREAEGERMRADLLLKLNAIEDTVKVIEERTPSVAQMYRERLYNKICETLGDKNIDEQRILTEVAIFSEKTATDEETVRLHSHISQFRELIESPEAVGRKLDFLVQEMNREVNTTGSKCQDLAITKMVVDMKSEIEKIREQIQNIE